MCDRFRSIPLVADWPSEVSGGLGGVDDRAKWVECSNIFDNIGNIGDVRKDFTRAALA